jgi:DNA-binding transcriptional LysR family regulator
MALVDRVTQRLKLRDLRLLDTVVRWGSMAKASSQLHLSQPAVSKAIAEMEQLLGVRLIERSRQGVEPTPHGRALLKRGIAIFDELRLGVAEIEYLSDPTVGEVRISASEPIAAGLLPHLIDRFSRRYPQVSIYVTQAPIASLQFLTPQHRDLRERNVDLILGPIFKPFAEEDLESEPLFQEPSVVAVGAKSKWARSRSITLAALMDEPWCLQPPNTRAGMSHLDAFRGSGLDLPRKRVTSISVQVQIGLLGTQRYLTIFPSSLLRFGGKRLSIKALPIELPVEPWAVGIVTLKGRTISPAAQLFIEMAREVTKALPEQRAGQVGQ